MARFAAHPRGPGLLLREAAFLVAYLEHQTSLLVPCLAQKQATARPRTKRKQTLSQKEPICTFSGRRAARMMRCS
ncbi:MAG TPA: hypothetical protein DIC26_19040 [Pseudomonas sp.]|nr:hypothetical protein [Pseudomonas sp.]